MLHPQAVGLLCQQGSNLIGPQGGGCGGVLTFHLRFGQHCCLSWIQTAGCVLERTLVPLLVLTMNEPAGWEDSLWWSWSGV